MPKTSIEPVVARLEEAFRKSLRTIPAHQAGGGEMFFVTSVDIQSLRHLTERDEEHVRRMREISPYSVDLQAVRINHENEMVLSAPLDPQGYALQMLSELAIAYSNDPDYMPQITFDRDAARVVIAHSIEPEPVAP